MKKFDWDHPIHLQPMSPSSIKQVRCVWDAYEATKDAHGICILTEWDEFKTLDYHKIYDNMQKPAFVFDGRNVVDADKLRKIGFRVRVRSWNQRVSFKVQIFDEDDDSNIESLEQFDSVAKQMQGVLGRISLFKMTRCISFEFQVDKVDFCDPVDAGAALQVNGVKVDDRECLPGNSDVSNYVVDQVYSLDHCDAKAWDTRYTVPTKGVDLMEEIFGQGTSSD
ncbi:hypothetical protein GH714_028953 [Hevea brasiliensis]|uniref:UDP-glucose/GDP-mannose dehydrogenase C-terminal domain-containing protein n=1 Tax=Hevea brasiliensis TaxID=3981 RepID=A0A6A6NJU5_HEVBR|nr:hypothetical protein GH714_028953 [Hevea brasiliensis]